MLEIHIKTKVNEASIEFLEYYAPTSWKTNFAFLDHKKAMRLALKDRLRLQNQQLYTVKPRVAFTFARGVNRQRRRQREKPSVA